MLQLPLITLGTSLIIENDDNEHIIANYGQN